MLSITETETCIVHLYSMDGMMDQDVAQCNTESGHGAGTASDCWTWVADYVETQTCQDSINSIMDQVSRHRSVFTWSCASIQQTTAGDCRSTRRAALAVGAKAFRPSATSGAQLCGRRCGSHAVRPPTP